MVRLDPSLTKIDPEAWVAPGAVVLGDVVVGPRATIWFACVVRGDTDRIAIGEETNIQDGCVLHADPGYPCRIGDRVTVGHRAVVHGATVEDGCLIGMSATLLNGARIGAGSIVGAGALVPEGKQIPPRSLVVGVPARVVREVSEEEARLVQDGVHHYVEAGRSYREAGYGA